MDINLKITDLAIIVATIIGPVFAVQAQKWLENSRAIRQRRQAIFSSLMATRATRLSSIHVEALNAIPVEFYGSKGALKDIQHRWRSYLNLLNRSEETYARRNDGFIELLYEISKFLGYDFGRADLQSEFYHPTGHVEVESDQITIRKGLASVFEGKFAIHMAVKEMPVVMPQSNSVGEDL